MAAYNFSNTSIITSSQSNATNATNLADDVGSIMRWTLMSLGSVTFFMNVFVLVVMARFSWMRSNANIILASMAVTDLVAGSCAFTAGLVKWSDWVQVPPMFCFVYMSLDYWAAMASILHILVVNFERYVAIITPFKYENLLSRRKLGLLLAFVWLFSGVQAVLHVLFVEIDSKCLQGAFKNTAVIFAILVLNFPIPLLLVSIMYSRIVAVIIRKLQFMKQNSNKQDNSAAKCQMIKSISIIFAAYIICWGPTIGVLLAVSGTTLVGQELDFSQLVTLFYFFEVLAYANSLANPVIYFMLGKDFRRAARTLFTCNSKKYGQSENQTVSTVDKKTSKAQSSTTST